MGALQCIGEYGEMLDVKALRDQWMKGQEYCVAPQGAPVMLHLLLLAAQNNTHSPEDLKRCLAKITEVLETVWPVGKARSVTLIKHGKAVIHFSPIE
jgi:hypothetical protein